MNRSLGGTKSQFVMTGAKDSKMSGFQSNRSGNIAIQEAQNEETLSAKANIENRGQEKVAFRTTP